MPWIWHISFWISGQFFSSVDHERLYLLLPQITWTANKDVREALFVIMSQPAADGSLIYGERWRGYVWHTSIRSNKIGTQCSTLMDGIFKASAIHQKAINSGEGTPCHPAGDGFTHFRPKHLVSDSSISSAVKKGNKRKAHFFFCTRINKNPVIFFVLLFQNYTFLVLSMD